MPIEYPEITEDDMVGPADPADVPWPEFPINPEEDPDDEPVEDET